MLTSRLVEGNRNTKNGRQHKTAVDIHHTRLSYWNSIFFLATIKSNLHCSFLFRAMKCRIRDWKFLSFMWTVAPIHFESLRISLESARFFLARTCAGNLGINKFSSWTCWTQKGQVSERKFPQLDHMPLKKPAKTSQQPEMEVPQTTKPPLMRFPMDIQHPPIHRPEAFQKWEHQPPHAGHRSNWSPIVPQQFPKASLMCKNMEWMKCPRFTQRRAMKAPAEWIVLPTAVPHFNQQDPMALPPPRACKKRSPCFDFFSVSFSMNQSATAIKAIEIMPTTMAVPKHFSGEVFGFGVRLSSPFAAFASKSVASPSNKPSISAMANKVGAEPLELKLAWQNDMSGKGTCETVSGKKHRLSKSF